MLKEDTMSSDKKKKWSKSESTDKKGKDITIREIDNGYIVEIYKWWYDEDDKYESERKEFYSKDNPLEEKEEKEEKEDDKEAMFSSLKGMF